MVRLSKDAASPLDPERLRLLTEHVRDAFAAVGVRMLRMSAAAHEAVLGLREPMEKIRQAERQVSWMDQWPVYRCPYALDYGEAAACGEVWDRLHIPTPELRALVWEHIQDRHVGGERGRVIADVYLSQIMDRP